MFYAFYMDYPFFDRSFNLLLSLSQFVCLFFSVFQFIFAMSFANIGLNPKDVNVCACGRLGMHMNSMRFTLQVCNVSLINSQIITNYTVSTHNININIFKLSNSNSYYLCIAF